MKKTLEYYMNKACHSQEKSPLLTEMRRNRFIQYCKEHELDKRFIKLLNNDPFWRAIAEVKQIYFLEEIISEYKAKGKKLPSIQLQILGDWSIPVIKLILPQDTTYFV